jgi:pimeloyl-ACP methyl ester carboxylesterase
MIHNIVRIHLLVAVASFIFHGSAAAQALGAPVKNIVLVHGAWVGGAGWRPVYEILVKDGYHVSVVQEPLTSLEEDVAATVRVLNLQQGSCILVAHSYGGTVITEAGTDPHVVGLVYIAAHEPDTGETEAANGTRYPSATSKTQAIKKTADGFTYLDPAEYFEDFAADLPRAQAEFEAHAQMLTAGKVFTTAVTNPAWKVKPSWALVATKDRIINPDLERMYLISVQSIAEGGPEGFGFGEGEFAAQGLAGCGAGGPVGFWALCNLCRSECRKGGAVAGDRDLFAVLDPFGDVGEVVAEVADGGGFHCDTGVYRG